MQPTPKVDYQLSSRPTGGASGCIAATVDFVVDSLGRFERGTERLVQTNDSQSATALIAALPLWRFEPAKKSGAHVRQIYRKRFALSFQTSVVPAGQMPTRPSGATRRPVC